MKSTAGNAVGRCTGVGSSAIKNKRKFNPLNITTSQTSIQIYISFLDDIST